MPGKQRLIARERELAAFAEAIACVRAGVGGCVIVTGEPGIGKTRLADHALRAGSIVTYAGAARSAVAEPYSPVAQVLRACLRQRPDLPEACGPLAAHLAPLLPELGQPPPDAGEATLIEALRRAFAAMAAAGPVAVLLDDLHWADEATLLLLPHLATELRQVPLLLVIAARDEVPVDTHRLRRLRAQLRRVCDPVELALEPLDRDDTARLAAAVTGDDLDDETVAALHDRTHGVPFYVEELAATLGLEERRAGSGRLPLPETVLDAVLLRTEVLSLAGRNALEAAAVAGVRCVVAQVPSLEAADGGLAEAVAAGLLVEDGPGCVAFRHALVRDAVYHVIPWTRRRSLHAAVAGALEESGASPAERAPHWLGAGDVERARSALAEAATASARVYAYRDATDLYERALDLDGGGDTQRFELLECLAVCAELAGDLAASARAWREVIDGRRGRGEVERVAEAQYGIGRVLRLRGSNERALTAWFAAADGYAACGRGADAARARLAAADLLQVTGRLRPALTSIESTLADLGPDAPVELRSTARSLQGTVLGKLGRTGDALAVVRAALAESLVVGHTLTAAGAYQALAVVYENTGDLEQATEAYEVAIDYCATNGFTGTSAACQACLCHVLRQRGEWRRSLALCQSLLDDPFTGPGSSAIACAVMSQIHACRGERRPARRRVLEAGPVVRQRQLLGPEIECLWTVARLELLEGSPEAAVEQCREVLRRWEATEDLHYSLNALAWAAGVFAAQGEGEDLQRCVRALSTIAVGNGNREPLALLAGAIGELALFDGTPAVAVEHFQRAIDLHASIELPHDRAELLVSAAAAAHAAGRDDQARAWLIEARLGARRLGARPLQAVAERRLADLGGGTATLAAGLTPRQLQIIRRVAAGRTNREIAAELYLSVRTVDMHVRNSLMALGCRSRVDAARTASELGLLEPSR